MSKSDETKRRETDQLFNIAERPVMEFISAFLEEPASILFKDEIPDYVEPLILMPFADYKEKICIKFTLKPITKMSPERKNFIDSVIKYPKVKEGIGFLLYCVKQVYTTLAATMNNTNLLTDTILELNEEDWVFYSKYVNPLSTKKTFLENTLGRLMYIKQEIDRFPPDMAEQINTEFPRVIEQLKNVNSLLTPEILAEEKSVNDKYINKPVLGIFVEEMNESELPKHELAARRQYSGRSTKNTAENTADSAAENTAEKNIGNNTEHINIEEKTAELFK